MDIKKKQRQYRAVFCLFVILCTILFILSIYLQRPGTSVFMGNSLNHQDCKRIEYEGCGRGRRNKRICGFSERTGMRYDSGILFRKAYAGRRI